MPAILIMLANAVFFSSIRRTPNQGGKMKYTSQANWDGTNTMATNISGLTALPGGPHDNSSTKFSLVRMCAYFGHPPKQETR